MAGPEHGVSIFAEGGNHEAVQLPALLQEGAQPAQVLTPVIQQTLPLLRTEPELGLQQSPDRC